MSVSVVNPGLFVLKTIALVTLAVLLVRRQVRRSTV